jgi:hypothetical protein
MKWTKEAARDVLALGSVPFYSIVVVRSLIGPYYLFFYQLAIAAALLFAASLAFKNSDNHVSRSWVLLVFTVLFYTTPVYTLFASVLWLLVATAAVYLGKKKMAVAKGFFIGLFCAVISYVLASKIPIPSGN